jgi:prepilin signal peptidase PulO-like enzyme (type II secretory pathway)
VTIATAAAACILASAFWSVGRAAAMRRALSPGHLPGVLLLAAAVAGARSPALPALAAICGALVAGTIDARTGAIPDPLSVSTALVALGFSAVENAFLFSLGGALLTGGALLALHALTAGRGLGLGDVKLTAAIGAGLGASAGIAAIGVAFVLGAIVASWLLLTRRARPGGTMHFGPFLAAGACCAALLPMRFAW